MVGRTGFNQNTRLFVLGTLAAQCLDYANAEKPTNYVSSVQETIAEGRTQQNGGGNAQELTYSTITNSKGKHYFEMMLQLESEEVNDKYVIQQWFQIVDEKETKDLQESDCDSDDWDKGICTYYESLTCSFQYTDKILDGGVSIANSIIQGYKGVLEIKDGIGAFNEIVILNKTSTYPWFIDYERSDVKKISDAETQQTKLVTTCSVFRDFITDWSEIEIKVGDELKAVTGYRMYSGDTQTSPFVKGNSDRISLKVMEGASGLVSAITATSLLLLSVL